MAALAVQYGTCTRFLTEVPAEVHVPQLETRREAVELFEEVYRRYDGMLDGQ